MELVIQDNVLLGIKNARPHVAVPEGVKRLHPGCLRNNPFIQEIILPDSLEEIGSVAFKGCHNLMRIHFPAFLKLIGARAFEDCIALGRISLCAEKIGQRAFALCQSLEEADIAGTLNKDAFYGCRNLSLLHIHGQAVNVSERVRLGIPDAAGFLIHNDLLLAHFGADTDLTIPVSVREIGPKAFRNHYALHNICFPPELKLIGASAFDNCRSLQKIQLPDTVEEIGANAFRQCYSLRQAYIPAQCRISAHAFYGCSQVTLFHDAPRDSLGIPDEHGFLIQDGVLMNYWGDMEYIDIPEGVTHIAPRAFNLAFSMFDPLRDQAHIQLPETMENVAYFPVLRGGSIAVSRSPSYLRKRTTLPGDDTLQWLQSKWQDVSLEEWAHIALFQGGKLREFALAKLKGHVIPLPWDTLEAEFTPEELERLRMLLQAVPEPSDRIQETVWQLHLDGVPIPYSTWKNLVTSLPESSGLVWQQGDHSFTILEGNPVDNMCNAFDVRADLPVTTAHASSMSAQEAQCWRTHFSQANIPSFRNQMHEPAYGEIHPVRYAGCRVAIESLRGLEDEGITLYFLDHNEIGFELHGSLRLGSRLQIPYGKIAQETDMLELGILDVQELDRRTNRLLYILDLLTVHERLQRDDPTLAPLLACASSRQIDDWLPVAMENKASQAVAALLQAKQAAGIQEDELTL